MLESLLRVTGNGLEGDHVMASSMALKMDRVNGAERKRSECNVLTVDT